MAIITTSGGSVGRLRRGREISAVVVAAGAVPVALAGVWWVVVPVALAAVVLTATLWRRPDSAWRSAAVVLTVGAVVLTAVVGLLLTPTGPGSRIGGAGSGRVNVARGV